MKQRVALFLSGALILLAAGCSPARLAPGAPMPEPAVVEMQRSAAGFDAAAEAPSLPGESAFSAGQPGLAAAERLVVRNANLRVVVRDPAGSIDEIGRMAEEMGGFVVSSNMFQTTFAEGRVTANTGSITIRVPADRLQEALQRIRQGAVEVQSQSQSGEDVTQQFVDLQSRLRNLEAAEEQLRGFLERSGEIEDVLNVYNHLVQVRGEIEMVKGQIRFFEESARLSAVTVELIPDVASQPLEIGGWRPQGTAKQAFETLIRTLQFLGDAAIWGGICVLPVAAIVGLPLIWTARWLRRRRAKRAAKAETTG